MDDIKPPARFKPIKPPVHPNEPLLEASKEPLIEASGEPLLEATNIEDSPKKPKLQRKHRLLIIGACVVVIIILAIVGTLLYPHKVMTDPAPKPIDKTTANDLQDAASAVTTEAGSEISLTESNDSNIAGDASNAANAVGSSINENNF